MQRTIRIGTRDSELALWQAKNVQQQLEKLGYPTQLIPVKAEGDLVLNKPLYQLGITGIFTRTLDVAMLNGNIDIAVHSMKDVPTALPKGIVQAAVLKRANHQDILVHKGDLSFLNSEATIATGSLRRKAQWLNKYPNHKVEDLRGNVNTRLQKLKNSNWNGAIFAQAGLERINLKPEEHRVLDWMVPAPAQGAMVVVAMQNDGYSREALTHLNHAVTQTCVTIERQFLKTLEGGCTAPIGALATLENGELSFDGVLVSLDGKQKVHISKRTAYSPDIDYGKTWAQEVLENGGADLMKHIKLQMHGH